MAISAATDIALVVTPTKDIVYWHTIFGSERIHTAIPYVSNYSVKDLFTY